MQSNKSAARRIQQCLGPADTLTTEWCPEMVSFRHLSNHVFRIH